MATLTTLVSFNDTDGGHLLGSLIADVNGDLFGTTAGGGTNNDGTVFEIAKTANGYAGTPTTLVSFNNADGANPGGGLIFDATGDLYGMTAGDGTAFEIVQTANSYASTPTTLVSFPYTTTQVDWPQGRLVADPNGDLFDTTVGGGANDSGTVFEIAKTANGYDTTPSTLASYGTGPDSNLIADANGDLFGTALAAGTMGNGSVFEVAKTANGYANTASTLVSFDNIDGRYPFGSLIIDANGDLFGTTNQGGTYGDGTVFEIAKTADGYASTPITLVSFNNTDGGFPDANLIADAYGDLFGTTAGGGTNDDGTVFEIAKTGNGYATTPTTLVNFNYNNGYDPEAGLIADANGNLFGTTFSGGLNGDGTVFEITNSGFIPILFPSIPGNVDEWILSGGQWLVSAEPGSHPSGYEVAAVGDFTGSGAAGILWYDAATGDTDEWKMSEGAWAGSVDLGSHPGNFNISGAGKFTGNGIDDVLWTSASGGSVQTDIWELNSNGKWTASVSPGSHPAGYTVAGIGDWTGNGTDGILWLNASTGDTDEWQLNNGQWAASVDLGSHPGAGWTIAGVGDFLNNGRDDVLWTGVNSNGTVGTDIWELDPDGKWMNSVSPGNHPAGYSVVGIGDFNGDGTSDILWQNSSTGDVDEWLIKNGQWAGSIGLGSHPGGFQIAGVGSFTGNGTSDILWHAPS